MSLCLYVLKQVEAPNLSTFGTQSDGRGCNSGVRVELKRVPAVAYGTLMIVTGPKGARLATALSTISFSGSP